MSALKFGGEKPKKERKKKEVIESEPPGILRARLSGKLAGIGQDAAHIEQDIAMLRERIIYAISSDLLTPSEKGALRVEVPTFISGYKPGTLAPLVILADSIQAAYEKRAKA